MHVHVVIKFDWNFLGKRSNLYIRVLRYNNLLLYITIYRDQEKPKSLSTIEIQFTSDPA